MDNCNHPLSEGIDYSKTFDYSIWGSDTKLVVDHMKRMPVGTWLNIAAGDGRYCEFMGLLAEHILAIDVDASALAKLERVHNAKGLFTTRVTSFEDFDEASRFNTVFTSGFIYLHNPDTVKRLLMKAFYYVSLGEA